MSKKTKHKKAKSVSNNGPSIFEKAKDYLSLGEYIVPPSAMRQCKEFYILSGIIVLAGIIVSAISHDIMGVICTIPFAAIIAARGYYVILNVSKKGYTCIEGVCVNYKYTAIPRPKKKIAGFLIEENIGENADTDAEPSRLFYIPYFEQNGFIPQDSKVTIYVPAGASIYESRGLYNISNTLGYEITGSVISERKDEEESEG